MNTHAWIEALGWTLIHSLWQGAVLAAFLWLVQTVAGGARPQVRYVAGCTALFLLVVSAGVTFTSEIAKPRATVAAVLSANAVRSGPEPLAAGNTQQPLSSPSKIAISSGRASLPPSAPGVGAPAPRPFAWPSIANHLQGFLPAIVAAWFAGVLFFFLRLCRSWTNVQKLRRSGDSLEPESWSASLTGLTKTLRILRPVRFLKSAAVRVPMVIGWLKPVVLLPCSVVTGLPREQVEAIIAHELAHIRRHDYLVNLVQNAVETLFFFHPGVWWVSAQIRNEREHCCDDLAAAAIGGAVPYVTALAALEEACIEEARLVLAATGGSLLARARRLLAVTPAEGPGAGALVGAVTFVAVLGAFALPLAWSQLPSGPPKEPTTAAPATPQPPEGKSDSAPAVKITPVPGKYEQTRDLVYQWVHEFSRRPLFAVAINSKMERRSGAGERPSRDVVFPELSNPPTDIPPVAMRRLKKHIEEYIARSPGPNAEKFRALLPRIEEERRWTPAEAAAMLDELCDIATGPIEWLAIENQFRAFNLPKAGERSMPEKLAAVPDEGNFPVTAHDPQAKEGIGVATAPGRYQVASGIWLQVSQLTSGKDGEPIKRANTITIESGDPPKRATNSPQIKLPDGLDSYVLIWARGTPSVWIGESNRIRKIDLMAAREFPLNDVLETIASPADRDALRVAVEKLKSGGSPPEQEWRWDAVGNFGGIPAEVRAELLKRRPATPAGDASTEPPSIPLATPLPATAVKVLQGTLELRFPWRASGRVTDESGVPISDVEIWVHTGEGSLFRTGLAKTDMDGRYAVNFSPGVQMSKESSQLQFANVTAHKPGWFEKNLNRQGAGAGAMRDVSKDDLESFKVTHEQLVLPNKPREVNFVMAKAVKVKGRLLGTGSFPGLPPQDYRRANEKLDAGYVEHKRAPLPRWKVWLTGPVLAPATGVFASAETDADGRFEFNDVPPGYEWQIQADTHHRGKDPRSPLFKAEPGTDIALDVELDEKQNGLKILK